MQRKRKRKNAQYFDNLTQSDGKIKTNKFIKILTNILKVVLSRIKIIKISYVGMSKAPNSTLRTPIGFSKLYYLNILIIQIIQHL